MADAETEHSEAMAAGVLVLAEATHVAAKQEITVARATLERRRFMFHSVIDFNNTGLPRHVPVKGKVLSVARRLAKCNRPPCD